MRALALLLLLAACGEAGTTEVPDDTEDTEVVDTDPADTDAADTEDTDAADTDADDTDTDGVDTDTDTDAATSMGACDNTSDIDTLAGVVNTLSDTISSCTLGCVQAPRLGTCVTNCVVNDVGLSQACARCFGNSAVCVANNCLTQCIDPSSSACETCRQTNCDAGFTTCAGISPL